MFSRPQYVLYLITVQIQEQLLFAHLDDYLYFVGLSQFV